MRLGQMVVGSVATNCYFLENTETHEVILVDPGDRPFDIQNKIEDMGCHLVAILLTHGHFDHIMAVPALKDLYEHVKIYACAAEKTLLANPSVNCSSMVGHACSIEPDVLVFDGDKLEIAGIKIEVVTTPGHTEGSCCYYLPDENILLSGDTLFEGSIGRTDLPTGNMGKILDSLKKLFNQLPEDTDVFPGHGDSTTIRYEKRYNPFA